MKLPENVVAPLDIELLTERQTTRSICTIGILFFVFGFVTWINAILIPYFKVACELNNFQSYLVTFAFYISYFVMSIPASYLLKKVGFKTGMFIGFLVMSAGAFIFIPASMTRTYWIFLAGLFTIGVGLAVLQTAANPYITILGPKERAAQRISMMGICNKGAGILAPLLFSFFLLKSTDTEKISQLTQMSQIEKNAFLDELISRVMVPYFCLGLVLIGLGVLVWRSGLPEINTEKETDETFAANSHKSNILHFPHLVLGAFAIFAHVGTHVIAIDTVIGYAKSMGISLNEARVFPSYTLASTMLGYILGMIAIPRFMSQLWVLRICTLLGTAFVLAILSAGGTVTMLGHHTDLSLWFVILLGLPNSMIWAGIWPLALDGLGRFTKLGASVLIMGLCGQAILPLVYGYLADHYNLRSAYIVLLPCYLYLIFYAFRGFGVREWSVLAKR
jgi:FHS family L-fucose permease-like MFS transporter